MIVQCDICKANADVVSYTCCSGSVHSIECMCGGQDQYDGIALCEKCLEILNHLEYYGYAIHTKPQDEKGKAFALTIDDVSEVC